MTKSNSINDNSNNNNNNTTNNLITNNLNELRQMVKFVKFFILLFGVDFIN